MSNNKCVVHSDVHGRDTWETIVELYPVEEYYHIFLGDYVDSKQVDGKTIVANFRKIIDFKKANPDRVYLLMGNHDMQYLFLNDPHFMCSGFNSSIAGVLESLFTENENLFDIGIYLDATLLSHAGLCETWVDQINTLLRKYGEYPNVDEPEPVMQIDITNAAQVMNHVFHKGTRKTLELIGAAGESRGGWNPYGGPVWADKKELIRNFLPGLDQIVGHTFLNDGVPYTHYTDSGEKLSFIDLGNAQLNFTKIVEFNTLTK